MSGILGFITARGGSKGLPGKNLKILAGKPLIAWTIEAALQSQSVDRVLISTEDPEIAEVARQWGAEAPFMRPSELAGDTSSHYSVAEHALQWLEEHEGVTLEYLLLLQPTCPFRTAADIEAGIAIARARSAEAVVSVMESPHHPYWMKTLSPDGSLTDFISHDLVYPRRQDLPPVFVPNGAIYLNRPESLRRVQGFMPPGAYPYIMPPERSIDIDTAWDFRLAELLLKADH